MQPDGTVAGCHGYEAQTRPPGKDVSVEQTREADFDAFYVGSRRRVLNQIYAMTSDFAEAQDLMQEAYARAWQRWSKVGVYEDPEAWVRTVAWRLAASRWRRAKVGARAVLRHGPQAHAAAPNADTVALVAALRQLPVAQRRAVVLHHLVGRSVAEIAYDEGCAEGTVKARLSRGRAALAELLTDSPTVESRNEVTSHG
jgi:RNA polymerase sigma-70 factor, ECF subfamily